VPHLPLGDSDEEDEEEDSRKLKKRVNYIFMQEH
jgi:hypothetical protein